MLTWLYLKYQNQPSQVILLGLLVRQVCWQHWYRVLCYYWRRQICWPVSSKRFSAWMWRKINQGNLSRYMVPVVALVSLYFIFNGNDTLVAIMLLGVNIIAQFFPALIFSFAKESNHDCGRFFGDYGRCHYFGGHLCLSYFNSRYFPVHY